MRNERLQGGTCYSQCFFLLWLQCLNQQGHELEGSTRKCCAITEPLIYLKWEGKGDRQIHLQYIPLVPHEFLMLSQKSVQPRSSNVALLRILLLPWRTSGTVILKGNRKRSMLASRKGGEASRGAGAPTPGHVSVWLQAWEARRREQWDLTPFGQNTAVSFTSSLDIKLRTCTDHAHRIQRKSTCALSNRDILKPNSDCRISHFNPLSTMISIRAGTIF